MNGFKDPEIKSEKAAEGGELGKSNRVPETQVLRGGVMAGKLKQRKDNRTKATRGVPEKPYLI